MRTGLHNKRPRTHRAPRRGPGQNRNQTLDSNGPDVKVRGSASQIFEKYMALARDANSSGDRIMAENYMQHAEHYYRLLNANGGGQQRGQQQQQQQQQQGEQQPAQSNDGGEQRTPEDSAEATG